MCKTCFDMKNIRQCELICYCDACLQNVYYCHDWVWAPPQPTFQMDANQMDSFLNQLENISI